MEEFFEKIYDLFDDIESGSIDETTEFHKLEVWDSIAALSLISMVDEEYDVSLNAEDMKACRTLGEVYNRIMSKK